MVPPAKERLALPERSPCVHEGPVVTRCLACAEELKVRQCEHPEADWDFCARQATPLQHGQNCATGPLYEKRR